MLHKDDFVSDINLIEADVVNTGVYDWTVPVDPSDTVLIRVTEAGGGLSDDSDEYFEIVPQIYTKINDVEASINTLKKFSTDVKVQLNFKVGETGKNTLNANLEEFPECYNVFVEDKKQEVVHNLLNGEYEFYANVNDDEDRFVIHFCKPQQIASQNNNTAVEELIEDSQLKVYSQENDVYINFANDISTNATITVYSIDGKEIISFVNNNSRNVKFQISEKSAYYIVNVKGEENLIDAVKKCWASLFTARAIYYREKNKFKHKDVLISVVVQKMVNSDTAGVAFTANPVTNDLKEMIIEGSFGLGEMVVSGSVSPDSYIVLKDPLSIKDVYIAEKKKMMFRGENGENVFKDLSSEKANDRVLNEEQILELAKMCLKIEEHYGKPQDIEWAFEKGKLFITQSRPITTLK